MNARIFEISRNRDISKELVESIEDLIQQEI
jgi:hypothetical protein